MTVGAGEARAAHLTYNQSLFRDINDRVEELLGRATDTGARDDFLCECTSDICMEQITITLEQYREVRASPVTFAVAAAEEHVFADIERVVARNEGYWVVEKENEAGQVARKEWQRRAGSNGGGGG